MKCFHAFQMIGGHSRFRDFLFVRQATKNTPIPESTYATLKCSVLAHNSPTLYTCAKAVLGQCVGDY